MLVERRLPKQEMDLDADVAQQLQLLFGQVKREAAMTGNV